MVVEVVWFKRDLRTRDHRPLSEAAPSGPILPLYIIEPEVIGAPDFSRRHWEAARGCLLELRADLAELGMPLVVRQGSAVDVLAQLHAEHTIEALHAHEEIGNGITYARDRALRRWARSEAIPFYETPRDGVIRPLPDRDDRLQLWQKRMARPIIPRPDALQPIEGISPGAIPEHLPIPDEGIRMVQPTGERIAQETLDNFLQDRGLDYLANLSSPIKAEVNCSRLSVHLAYGSLSLRQILHALHERQRDLADLPSPDAARWLEQLNAFESRLAWRDHFIQKLEDEPALEYHSYIRAFDDLRDDPQQDAAAAARLDAFINAQTGYPMIDATIRCLRARGWINFRMRAMLVSFAAHDLWLRWQAFAPFLARLFTDYEPGIHYPQVQMQAFTTGNRTLRLYNPVKQARDHDPEGRFVRRWLPELRTLPHGHLFEPWKTPPMTQLECSFDVGNTYPMPIVDHKTAARQAKEHIGELLRDPAVKAEAARVRQKHGSRKWREQPA